MGSRDATPASTPEMESSPLSFSVPTSLQEYMGRYMHRDERTPSGGLIQGAALSPASFPVRHWFDERSGGDVRQPLLAHSPPSATGGGAGGDGRSSSAAGDGGVTGEGGRGDHARYAGRATSAIPSTRSERDAATAVEGPRQGDPALTPPPVSHPSEGYIPAWRGVPNPPPLGPVDSGCEDEEPQRLQGADRGGRRPQTRSASRGGRPRNSNPAERRRIAGRGRGDRRFGAGDRGGRVSHSPMMAMATDDHTDESYSPMSGARANMNANAWGLPVRHYRERGGAERVAVLEDNFRGVYGDSRGMANAGRVRADGRRMLPDDADFTHARRLEAEAQHQGPRRSLSDFLREVEEMVRAQRAESEIHEFPETRPQSAPDHEATGALPPQSATPFAEYGTAPPRGNARYVPPAERRAHLRGASLRPSAGRYASPRIQRSVGQPPQVPPWMVFPAERVYSPPIVAGVAPYAPSGGRAQPRAARPMGVTPLAAAALVEEGASGRARAPLPAAAEAGAGEAGTVPPQSQFRLSATATAFTLGGTGGGDAPADQPMAEDRSSMEQRARWVALQEEQQQQQRYAAEAVSRHAQYAQRAHIVQQQLDDSRRRLGSTLEVNARGEIVARSVAETSAERISTDRESFDASFHAAAGAAAGGGTAVGRGGAAPGQDQLQGAYMQVMSARASYMEALTAGGAHPSPAGIGAAPDATAGGDGGITREMSVVPAFRQWEAQRPRLRIQWQDPDAQSDTINTESLPSDGTLTLTDQPSGGPSPRGFGRSVPGGEGGRDASKVEEATFSCLSSLGVRRLLLGKGLGGVAVGENTRNSPGWLEEWLQRGARLANPDNTGPTDEEPRCPQVADAWDLLELLLGWWAERVCAVAAGFPTSRQASPGRRGDGMGTLAGDAVAAAQAVEAVQGLRELGRFMMPLSSVRDFAGVEHGPTPRDAVLLKAFLVMHEGIAWATDRPLYRFYREEIIPTALALYGSLQQDGLEGVDLEVGHMLPESMFLVTGTVRPSWPRWGGNPSTPPTAAARAGDAGNHPNRHSGSPNRNNVGSSAGNGGAGGGNARFGANVIRGEGTDGGVGGGGRGMRFAGGWGGSQGFMPGPWVVFRVAREDYLEFYGAQAAALDQVVGGLASGLEDMVC